MLDWKTMVREKLGAMALDADKREEILEELAQQLDATYQDELAKGVDKFEAARRSLAQFRDWEKLQQEIFHSVNGSQLPVWKQTGSFAPRRPLVWVALAVAVGFLAFPSFRKALHILSVLRESGSRDERALSEAALQNIQRSGDQQKYARYLAYVALHDPDQDRAAAAAQKAIALDPQLTWISAHFSGACCLKPVPNAGAWIEALKAWDPDNGYTHLLDAQAAIQAEWLNRWSRVSRRNGELRRALASDSHWRGEMEKVFSAPRTDSYVARQFALDRGVLLDRGSDYPDKLLLDSESVYLPNLGMLKMYADYLVLDVGAGEERAGRAGSALSIYRGVALFGQKMAGADTTLEQMLSAQIRIEALQRTVALLHRLGKEVEATNAELALAATLNEEKKSRLEFTSESIARRSGQLIIISGILVLLLSITVTAWLVCTVILGHWPNFSRRMNTMASRLGWAPLALFVACLGLFVSFFPYSKSIAEYSEARQLVAAFDGIFEGFMSLQPANGLLGNWIDHMFWPLLSCAAVALMGAAFLGWTSSRRPPASLAD